MLTNEEFREKLKNNPHNIRTTTVYHGNKTIMDCTCSLGHVFQTKAYNLIYNYSIIKWKNFIQIY